MRYEIFVDKQKIGESTADSEFNALEKFSFRNPDYNIIWDPTVSRFFIGVRRVYAKLVKESDMVKYIVLGILFVLTVAVTYTASNFIFTMGDDIKSLRIRITILEIENKDLQNQIEFDNFLRKSEKSCQKK